MDYSTEPEEIFYPLTSQRYCEFYDIEMMDFDADLPFYLSQLRPGMDILELGCGSGRLSRALAARGYFVTGIDISDEMLARASSQDCTNITYIRMDMTEIALPKRFDAVIIPYNTLNLLVRPGMAHRCLQRSRNHLNHGGLLLMQVFLPNGKTPEDARTFQFQIFERPNGGKIIKEAITTRRAERQQITLVERYRVRPMNTTLHNEDFAHSMDLLALPLADWVRLTAEAGFTITRQFGDYSLTPFVAEDGSLLLMTARASGPGPAFPS